MRQEPILYDKSTGSGAVARSITPNAEIEILQVDLKLSTSGAAGNFTMDVNYPDTAYSGNDLTQAMVGLQSVLMNYGSEGLICRKDATISLAYSNSGSATWGLVISYRRIA